MSPVILWLSVAFFFIFAGAAQQQFQSPYWERARPEWTPTTRSAILAVVYLSFGFCRLQIGRFIRAWGEKTVLIAGALTYAGFCLTVACTTRLPALLLAAVVWGWGAAANWGTSAVMVLDASRDRRYGGSTGLFKGTTNIGFAVGVVALSLVYGAAERSGDPLAGRVVWFWATGFTLVGIGFLFLLPSRETTVDPPSLAEQLAMMRSPKGSIGSLFLFLGGAGFGVMLSLLADHLARGLGAGNKLYLAAGFALAGGLATYVGGPLSDRIGRAEAMLATFAAATAGLLLAGLWPSSVAAVGLCAVLLGMQSGLVPVLTTAMIGDSAKSARRQNAYGALFFWRDMGVVVSLVLSQALRQRFSVQPALLTMAALSALCAWLCVPLARRAEEQL